MELIDDHTVINDFSRINTTKKLEIVRKITNFVALMEMQIVDIHTIMSKKYHGSGSNRELAAEELANLADQTTFTASEKERIMEEVPNSLGS